MPRYALACQVKNQALAGTNKCALRAPTNSDTVDGCQAEHAITRRMPLPRPLENSGAPIPGQLSCPPPSYH
uniref:Uncharacterized protein n=1 Tax=Oryza rufipogon TaxID=4529 RepID=A0A0E0R5R0_ORYRU